MTRMHQLQMENDSMSGWQNLADAIILKAAEDYRRTAARLKKHPDDQRLLRERGELEQFFSSGRFQTLTSLDGGHLLRRLELEQNTTEEQK